MRIFLSSLSAMSLESLFSDFVAHLHSAEFLESAPHKDHPFGGRVGIRHAKKRALFRILCEEVERTVGKDNCVQFDGMTLQIPQDRHRHHYMKVKVRVHRYLDGSLALFHGPRKLANYDDQGQALAETKSLARKTASGQRE